MMPSLEDGRRQQEEEERAKGPDVLDFLTNVKRLTGGVHAGLICSIEQIQRRTNSCRRSQLGAGDHTLSGSARKA
jgi:hypothetical protein